MFTGICPYTPAPKPYITTTAAPYPATPCNNGPVCGILNGVWKTFINITEFNKEVIKGIGKFYRFFSFKKFIEMFLNFKAGVFMAVAYVLKKKYVPNSRMNSVPFLVLWHWR